MGVSLAIVIGASLIAAIVYAKLNKNLEKDVPDNRRNSEGNTIMNRIHLQNGLMQFSQPDPDYIS
jgi:hypothetical protein